MENKIKIAMFDTKSYDRIYFEKLCPPNCEVTYFEHKLNKSTASSTKGFDVVVPFVNDDVNKCVIDELAEDGVKLIAMRCAGYNNVDIKYIKDKIKIARVPAYSPYAVAEHAMALLLCLNRRIHKAFIRTRDHNFSLEGLMGWDLHGKVAGVIGTGKIGRIFIKICRGFGMEVIAYDPYPVDDKSINYVSLDELLEKSDIISLHCPLNESTKQLINENTIKKMKNTAALINTSRGALVDSRALLEALIEKRLGAAALDVYEEEGDLFFEDYSDEIVDDEILTRLVSLPNVIITSHQAFLTREALENIASVTYENITQYFESNKLPNEITG